MVNKIEGSEDMIKLKEGSSARWEMFGMIAPSLGHIFYDAVMFLQKQGVNDVTITSIIRPKTEDSGVHEVGRAIDIRTDFSSGVVDALIEYLNKRYIYDIYRRELKTAIYHSTSAAGDAGCHIHIQVFK